MSTFAIELTSPQAGAIAVVAVIGPKAGNIADHLCEARGDIPARSFRRVALVHHETRAAIDDGLLVRVSADHYEFHVHGGTAVVLALLNALEAAGAQKATVAQACEAKLFGEGLETELMLALPRAITLGAARLLARQVDAGLAAWCQKWDQWLSGKASNELWPFHSAVQWLLDRSAKLAQLFQPPRIAIVGPPNAGKSALANALLGRPVSITSPLAGTTRDWVDAETFLSHGDAEVAVTLVDTAGVRAADDELEAESIRRSHTQARAADLLLFVFDSTQPPTPSDAEMLQTYAAFRHVVIANKIDAPAADADRYALLAPNIIPISAKSHKNLEAVSAALLAQLDLADAGEDEAFAFTQRHRDLLSCMSQNTDTATIRALIAELLKSPHP